MHTCPQCNKTFDTVNESNDARCPDCGIATSIAPLQPKRLSFPARLALGFLPSLAIMGAPLTALVLSQDPIAILGVTLLANPIAQLFWAKNELKVRCGEPGENQNKRYAQIALLAVGMTIANACVAFAGCFAAFSTMV